MILSDKEFTYTQVIVFSLIQNKFVEIEGIIFYYLLSECWWKFTAVNRSNIWFNWKKWMVLLVH